MYTCKNVHTSSLLAISSLFKSPSATKSACVFVSLENTGCKVGVLDIYQYIVLSYIIIHEFVRHDKESAWSTVEPKPS